MKKNLLLLGMSAALCSQLNAFDYEIKNGAHMLGAVVDIEDFTPFHNKCVDYLYRQDLSTGVYTVHSANTNLTGYAELQKISKGEGFILNATGDCTVTVEDPSVIQHNGVTYNAVTSPSTGKTWLDKNLGAANVCSQDLAFYNNDAAAYTAAQSGCFGDYYQWGRRTDGHQIRTSDVTTAEQTSLTLSDNKFVLRTSSTNYGDWIANSTKGTRSSNWQSTDGTSMCPVGFRVPLRADLENEFQNITTASKAILNFPISGTRYKGQDKLFFGEGQYGALWASTLSTTYSNYPDYISFGSSYTLDQGDASTGRGVRCIKVD